MTPAAPAESPGIFQKGYGLLHLDDLAGYKQLRQPLRLPGTDFPPAPGTPGKSASSDQAKG